MDTKKLEQLISELDTAVGMLLVAARHSTTVREAMEKISSVSSELGEIAWQEEESQLSEAKADLIRG